MNIKKLLLALTFGGLAVSTLQISPGDKPAPTNKEIAISFAVTSVVMAVPALLTYYLLKDKTPSGGQTLSEKQEAYFPRSSKPSKTKRTVTLAGKQPEQLAKILDKIKNPEPYLAANPNAKISNMIFYGPPGTGKTERARWLAQELDAYFIEKSPGDLRSPFIGATTPLVRRLFADARALNPDNNKPKPSTWSRLKTWTSSWFIKTSEEKLQPALKKPYCVIFIDEIDGLEERSTAYADYRINGPMDTLLAELTDPENEGILLIGACNQLKLDPAFSRRFRDKIEVPLPDQADLRDIFNHYIVSGDYGFADGVIARRAKLMHKYQFSGDDVKNTLEIAAESAGKNRRLITQEDFDHAINLMHKNKQANKNQHTQSSKRPRAQQAIPKDMGKAYHRAAAGLLHKVYRSKI